MTNNRTEKTSNRQRQNSSDSATGIFIGGMIVGAAVGVAAGAIAGLLVAPQNGQETRKLLKQSADALPDLAKDVSTTVQYRSKQLVESSLTGWEQTLLRLRSAITTGLAVSQQERQRLQGNQSLSPNQEPSPKY